MALDDDALTAGAAKALAYTTRFDHFVQMWGVKVIR